QENPSRRFLFVQRCLLHWLSSQRTHEVVAGHGPVAHRLSLRQRRSAAAAINPSPATPTTVFAVHFDWAALRERRISHDIYRVSCKWVTRLCRVRSAAFTPLQGAKRKQAGDFHLPRTADGEA